MSLMNRFNPPIKIFTSQEVQVENSAVHFKGLLLENKPGRNLIIDYSGTNLNNVLSREHRNAVKDNRYTFFNFRSSEDILLSFGWIDTRKWPKQSKSEVVFKTTHGSIFLKQMSVFSRKINISNFSYKPTKRINPTLTFSGTYFEALDMTIRGQSLRDPLVKDFLIKEGFTVSEKGKFIVLDGRNRTINFFAKTFDSETNKKKTERKQIETLSLPPAPLINQEKENVGEYYLSYVNPYTGSWFIPNLYPFYPYSSEYFLVPPVVPSEDVIPPSEQKLLLPPSDIQSSHPFDPEAIATPPSKTLTPQYFRQQRRNDSFQPPPQVTSASSKERRYNLKIKIPGK